MEQFSVLNQCIFQFLGSRREIMNYLDLLVMNYSDLQNQNLI